MWGHGTWACGLLLLGCYRHWIHLWRLVRNSLWSQELKKSVKKSFREEILPKRRGSPIDSFLFCRGVENNFLRILWISFSISGALKNVNNIVTWHYGLNIAEVPFSQRVWFYFIASMFSSQIKSKMPNPFIAKKNILWLNFLSPSSGRFY